MRRIAPPPVWARLGETAPSVATPAKKLRRLIATLIGAQARYYRHPNDPFKVPHSRPSGAHHLRRTVNQARGGIRAAPFIPTSLQRALQGAPSSSSSRGHGRERP